MLCECYISISGKDIIAKELSKIRNRDARESGFALIEDIEKANDLDELDIRPWKGKIKEIYFGDDDYRMFMTIKNNIVYILHVSKKQKNQTEKLDRDIVIKRFKELS